MPLSSASPGSGKALVSERALHLIFSSVASRCAVGAPGLDCVHARSRDEYRFQLHNQVKAYRSIPARWGAGGNDNRPPLTRQRQGRGAAPPSPRAATPNGDTPMVHCTKRCWRWVAPLFGLENTAFQGISPRTAPAPSGGGYEGRERKTPDSSHPIAATSP